jgi:hypothetical protein
MELFLAVYDAQHPEADESLVGTLFLRRRQSRRKPLRCIGILIYLKTLRSKCILVSNDLEE